MGEREREGIQGGEREGRDTGKRAWVRTQIAGECKRGVRAWARECRSKGRAQ